MYYLCPAFDEWSDARVAEEARLESVYTSKAYPEFESRSLRNKGRNLKGFLPLFYSINSILAAVGQGITAEPFGLNPSEDVIAIHFDLDPITLDLQRHELEFLSETVNDVGLFIRSSP